MRTLSNDTTKNGYTSEIAAWLILAEGGNDIGNNGTKGSGIVYIDPIVWRQPHPTVQCEPPCLLVLPPFTLPEIKTFTFPPYKIYLEVGWNISIIFVTTDITASVSSSLIVLIIKSMTIIFIYYTSATETIMLTIPSVTGLTVFVWNVQIDSTVSSSTICFFSSILPLPFVITDDPNLRSSPRVSYTRNIRIITLPSFLYSSGTETSDCSNILVYFIKGPPKPIYYSSCGYM